MNPRDVGSRRQRNFPSLPLIGGVLLLILMGARTVAHYILEYEWWTEMGQVQTWTSMLLYGLAPKAGATLLLFALFWIAHARGLKAAGTGLREHPGYARISTLALLVIAFMASAASVDTWTVVRFFGAKAAGSPGTWLDPVFGKTLGFYIFELPFYSALLGLVLAATILAALIHWLSARFWHFRSNFPTAFSGEPVQVDLRDLRPGHMELRYLRFAGAVILIVLAVRFYLARYSLLLQDHGFLVGVEYVAEHVSLPLVWVSVLVCLVAAAFILIQRYVWALGVLLLLVLNAFVPSLVNSVYVRPNELAFQRPYIERHIEATRAAYGLSNRLTEMQFPAKMETRIDPNEHRGLLDNVRLWDWRAFHDTVMQLQALRQYYVFADTDVDRYMIDGQLRQVMLSPRELDVRQMPEARTNWINPHFIYTHGYGLVMAEANRITASGAPVFFIEDAPPRVETSSLQLTRPELYYSEVTHEPVFVGTAQPEFNYPSGSDNVHTKYEGRGGIPMSSVWNRLVASVNYGDWKILLTQYLKEDSRMMIRRNVSERLNTLADFLLWDGDPYLVVSASGRLVWMADGFTTSQAHPYSRRIGISGAGTVNYMRNAVKATIDAYDGTVNLYVFDPQDPIIQAWRAIFPALFHDRADMPADLQAHARYPETLFRAQAEIYRTFHMRDPESFYNKEDLWDVAKTAHNQGGKAELAQPTYVVASIPGQDKPEFLLMLPFTPRNKDNMIGVMIARCDGDKLGELTVLQLSKQALIFGPLQMEARIDSDQNISKDLSLWNQQGSQVLRGQMLVLPVNDSFLYVQPIYIQAAQARMPQLKKVVLANGNTLIYRDTYEEALADLTGRDRVMTAPTPPRAPMPTGTPPAQTPGQPPAPTSSDDPRISEIRRHLQRYRELTSQGKWAEAGRELEAIQSAVQ